MGPTIDSRKLPAHQQHQQSEAQEVALQLGWCAAVKHQHPRNEGHIAHTIPDSLAASLQQHIVAVKETVELCEVPRRPVIWSTVLPEAEALVVTQHAALHEAP